MRIIYCVRCKRSGFEDLDFFEIRDRNFSNVLAQKNSGISAGLLQKTPAWIRIFVSNDPETWRQLSVKHGSRVLFTLDDDASVAVSTQCRRRTSQNSSSIYRKESGQYMEGNAL